ncbi:ferritin-like domain-containing protein [Pontibacter anaerobius]|uniref:Ferritin-like domain-containing protein n=1 Tax=Pontibacter anaerobius TaxID=2993940 RepID=A0ABT3RI56_9BACT|nr:ferritin-like domain-containing protein [Pontibacter anaerobius]MCX2740920.1 ferritin-like domain-containing protein [Pontibacter anaerobius]
MEKPTQKQGQQDKAGTGIVVPQRRMFLRYAGATALATTLLLTTSCDDDDDETMPTDPETVDLGSGDTGILNYAYALEQLEAAFYAEVVAKSLGMFSQTEQQIMQDLKGHEGIHRDFLKAALGNAAIPDLEVDFSTINFNDKNNILATARTFEDLGVAAYNGAGQYLENAGFLTLAGKIVSVEARHAAVIRDLISNGTFSDTADNMGLDPAMMPADVLQAAAPFIKNKISANNLPK